MVEPIENDQLNFEFDDEISKILNGGKSLIFLILTPLELLVFSCKVKKKNEFKINQTRNLVLTSAALYNFKNKRKQHC
jgi:hypothetical protein